MTTILTRPSRDTTGRDDEDAIGRIAAQFVDAWNAGDSAACAASFADDADFINILGTHDQGRDAIEAGHRFLFDTIYKGSRNHYAVEGIRFVRPDVAVAFLRAHLTFLDGGVAREIHARPTMVLAKDDGQWRVVVFQNTGIAGPAARSGADLPTQTGDNR